MISRVLILGGAAAMALAVLLAWVTTTSLGLKLGPIGVEVPPGTRTVHGTDTTLWPFILGGALAVAILGVAGIARKALLTIGLVVVAGGAALMYYLANVIDIASKDSNELEQALAKALISSSVGPGAPVLVGAGIAIVAGALLRR